MSAEVLLTLKLQRRLFADPRRIELLKQIRHTGSISQGAKLAGVSYKSAWDAVHEMNLLSEHALVERVTGGKGGGGTRLTRYGDRLIQLFELLGQIQQKAFAVLQDDQLPLDSLLAAISRFSLQTSARNQLFGTVIGYSGQPLLPSVDILLADGINRIRAAITRQSVERLGLSAGKEVLALIKAPGIKLLQQASGDNDNQLACTVSHLQAGENSCEITLLLAGGTSLCATILNTQLQSLVLQPEMPVYACFPAEQVIIATLC